MRLQIIDTGFFKLDGGAMFGVVPKVLWNKQNPADENNLCTWAMRCLLIEEGNRLMLVDTGIGNKQNDHFFKNYYLHGEDSLVGSIKASGYAPEDVTDVLLTHLHFDHCGGAVSLNTNQKPELTFKNATYWSNAGHWEWAVKPNAREKASFLSENILPIHESGQLSFIDQNTGSPFEHVSIKFVDGHTEKQMLPLIHYKGRTFAYMADLIPSIAHIPIPYIMSYDVRPLETMKEKIDFLEEACNNNYILIFEHDPHSQCCTLKRTEKGIRMDKTFMLSEVL